VRILRVSPASKGTAGRLRWLLEAEFDTTHGFVPAYGTRSKSDGWHQAFVAVDGDKVVGCLRYDRITTPSGGLRAGGTWVAPSHRGTGLAKRLWRRALRGQGTVEVITVSRGGKALIESLRRQYPKVAWIHCK
jgi:predicted N-acetyltransferase YhbS